MSSEPRRVREVLRNQILEVWGRRRIDLIPELYAPDIIDHDPLPGQPRGHEGLRFGVEIFHAAFPDLVMELHGTVVEGDKGVDFWSFSGTHTGPLGSLPATGRRVRFGGSDIVRVQDGRVAEIWHVEDMLLMALQLAEPGTPPAQALRALG